MSFTSWEISEARESMPVGGMEWHVGRTISLRAPAPALLKARGTVCGCYTASLQGACLRSRQSVGCGNLKCLGLFWTSRGLADQPPHSPGPSWHLSRCEQMLRHGEIVWPRGKILAQKPALLLTGWLWVSHSTSLLMVPLFYQLPTWHVRMTRQNKYCTERICYNRFLLLWHLIASAHSPLGLF
jgi:hypothetical protein